MNNLVILKVVIEFIQKEKALAKERGRSISSRVRGLLSQEP